MLLTNGEAILERMASAVEKVRDRLLRATAALEKAGVAYAVAGGNAVAAWVARVDEAAVRNTQDVDILLRRADLAAATDALEAAGFVYRPMAGMDVFLDGPDAKPATPFMLCLPEKWCARTRLCRTRKSLRPSN